MKEYVVTPEYEDSRLDRWFRKNIADISQNLLEKGIRKGDIRLNGNKVKANIRLNINDVIRVKENLFVQTEQQSLRKVSDFYIETVRKSVIFEDENLLIINKSENLPVQGGSKIRVSIDDILPYLDSVNKLRLVHRLDKHTTGALVIAKNAKSATVLTKAFLQRDIEKKYLAILTNTPKKSIGEIRSFVKKSYINGKERMIVSEEEGELAITKYKILKRFKKDLCLVEFMPVTGRTHQLRLHAENLGCPILGDHKYTSSTTKIPKKSETAERSNLREHNQSLKLLMQQEIQDVYLYLHSYSIDLGSLFGKAIKIKAELPIYFQEMITALSENKKDNKIKS